MDQQQPHPLATDLLPLVNSSEDLIWCADLNHRIILANDATVTLFREHQKIDIRPGTAVTDLFPLEQADAIEQAFTSVGRGKNLRITYTGINGREYAAKLHPIRRQGDIVGVSVFVRDITHSLQLQEELRRYEQIIASSPNMIALLNDQHCFEIANDAYLQAFGKQRQQLLGTHIKDLIGEKEYQQFMRRNLERALSGEHLNFESWFEFAGIGMRYLTVSYRPLGHHNRQTDSVIIIARDITDLKEVESDRQRIFDLSLDMLCVIDFDWQFLELNPAWQRITGWSKKDLLQMSWQELIAPEDYPDSRQVTGRLEQGESISGYEIRCRCKDGSYKWLTWSIYPDPDRKRYFATVRDVSAHKKMQDDLIKMATTDPLTGAGNRRHFINLAEAELLRVRRYGLQMAVLMIDVDHFKEVNDTYGHSAGDEVLKRLVECCHEQLRKTDIFGRFGGEEFAAVLVEINQTAALEACQRLLDAIAKLTTRTATATISITVSLGLTMYQADDTSIESILKRTDDALYQAKNSGRNQIVVY